MLCFPGFFGSRGENPSTVSEYCKNELGIPCVMGAAESVGTPLLGYWEGAGSGRAAEAAFCILPTSL